MIQSIRLQNFRSYSDESFEFEPGVNIIVGPNGSGKTNLLEAVLISSTNSSYRASDQELIKFDQDWARLDVITEDQSRTLKLITEYDRVKKTHQFDDKVYKIMTLQNSLPVVLFEPNHLQLLHGQPELRRNYLDNLLEQTIPGFLTTRKHYKRVLLQRNRLLKAAKQPNEDQMFVWNLRLSELGGVIAQSRIKLVSEIEKQISELYCEISGSKKTKVKVEYVSKINSENYETTMLKNLESSLGTDLNRGFTSFGPHRDDLLTTFNSRPASEVASRGETRTALLALKIFELQMVEEVRQKKPILLLDDVFSELDGRRRHSLASFLSNQQTLITTTDAELVLDNQTKSSKIIPLTGTN